MTLSQILIPIGLAAASIAFTVIWFYWRKRQTRLELLESAVFGHTGVHEKLHKYVTHEVLERRLTDFATSIRGMNEEGMRREERILEAIDKHSISLGVQIAEVKSDVRAQSQRIDFIITNSSHQR